MLRAWATRTNEQALGDATPPLAAVAAASRAATTTTTNPARRSFTV